MLKNIMQYIDGYFSLTAGHRGGPRWRHQRSGGDHTQEICEYTRNQSPPHPKKNNFNTITLFCISCNYEALSNFFSDAFLRGFAYVIDIIQGNWLFSVGAN